MTSTTNPAADPITLEVVRNMLDGIANEMQSTLVRSSFSPIVKEGLDASASLFTLEGETLAQATAIPIHLATLIPVVRTVIGKFPVGGMREGDIYIMNDPSHGRTHLPDIALVMPIFSRGRPIAFSAAMTHHKAGYRAHPGRALPLRGLARQRRGRPRRAGPDRGHGGNRGRPGVRRLRGHEPTDAGGLSTACLPAPTPVPISRCSP